MQLASVDICALVTEWQFLLRSRIDQIFHPDKTEFILRLHTPSVGNQMVRLVLGRMAYITVHKQAMSEPGPFCMRLRKKLNGAIIESIEQLDSQRIIIMKLKGRGEYYHLVIELFSKGNLILLDSQKKIIFPLFSQTWQSRDIKKGVDYIPPPMEHEWKSISENSLHELLKTTEKDVLVTSLAVELGLGGVYAEHVCNGAGLDKNLPPNEMHPDQAKLIYLSLNELRKELITPVGRVGERVSPINLPGEEFGSFNEALDSVWGSKILNRNEGAQKADKELKKLHRIHEEQQRAILEMEKGMHEATKKGELIFENYQHVKNILEELNKAAQRSGWESLRSRLKGSDVVKNLDLKHKRITIEL